jgi:hypothetical protein
MRHTRAGLILLEVLAALAIFTIAAGAVIACVHDSFHVVQGVRNAESEVRKASDLFDATTLWTRTELDQRLGERRQGQWWLRINKETPELYVLTLTDSTRQHTILHTSLYRRTPDEAP